MTKTTTLTDEQIDQLRIEAGRAGDTRMVGICQLALSPYDSAAEMVELHYEATLPMHAGGEVEMAVRGLGDMTSEQARAECARVIADARAQED